MLNHVCNLPTTILPMKVMMALVNLLLKRLYIAVKVLALSFSAYKGMVKVSEAKMES